MPPTAIRLLAVVFVLGGALAHAQSTDAVDVSAVADKLNVVTDGKGHYVVFAPSPGSTDYTFYGDGKHFFQLRVFSASSNGGTQLSRRAWDPRFGWRGVSFEYGDGKYAVECGERRIPVTAVPAAEARVLLDGATFSKPSWKWRAYLLARDIEGRYYYVDKQREPEDSKNFRLFVGPKGNLKSQKMTNIVSDSEGDIFATKTGSLRLIAGRENKAPPFWMQGKKRIELMSVPVEENAAIIYNDLGVYNGEKLGTPCDDL